MSFQQPSNTTHENLPIEIPNIIAPSFFNTNGYVQNFNLLCSKCSSTCDSQSARYIGERQDLETFLKSTFKGQLILMSYRKNQNLSQVMTKDLVALIVEREVHIVLKQQNTTLENPLQSLS